MSNPLLVGVCYPVCLALLCLYSSCQPVNPIDLQEARDYLESVELIDDPFIDSARSAKIDSGIRRVKTKALAKDSMAALLWLQTSPRWHKLKAQRYKDLWHDDDAHLKILAVNRAEISNAALSDNELALDIAIDLSFEPDIPFIHKYREMVLSNMDEANLNEAQQQYLRSLDTVMVEMYHKLDYGVYESYYTLGYMPFSGYDSCTTWVSNEEEFYTTSDGIINQHNLIQKLEKHKKALTTYEYTRHKIIQCSGLIPPPIAKGDSISREDYSERVKEFGSSIDWMLEPIVNHNLYLSSIPVATYYPYMAYYFRVENYEWQSISSSEICSQADYEAYKEEIIIESTARSNR